MNTVSGQRPQPGRRQLVDAGDRARRPTADERSTTSSNSSSSGSRGRQNVSNSLALLVKARAQSRARTPGRKRPSRSRMSPPHGESAGRRTGRPQEHRRRPTPRRSRRVRPTPGSRTPLEAVPRVVGVLVVGPNTMSDRCWGRAVAAPRQPPPSKGRSMTTPEVEHHCLHVDPPPGRDLPGLSNSSLEQRRADHRHPSASALVTWTPLVVADDHREGLLGHAAGRLAPRALMAASALSRLWPGTDPVTTTRCGRSASGATDRLRTLDVDPGVDQPLPSRRLAGSPKKSWIDAASTGPTLRRLQWSSTTSMIAGRLPDPRPAPLPGLAQVGDVEPKEQVGQRTGLRRASMRLLRLPMTCRRSGQLADAPEVEQSRRRRRRAAGCRAAGTAAPAVRPGPRCPWRPAPEVGDAGKDLLGAVGVDAAGLGLSSERTSGPPHEGHWVGRPTRRGRQDGAPAPGRPPRDDVAGLAHDHRVAGADVLRRDLVLVVEGGRARRWSHWTKTSSALRTAWPCRCARSRPGCRAGWCALGRELVGDGPPGALDVSRGRSAPTRIVDLHCDPVDLVGRSWRCSTQWSQKS